MDIILYTTEGALVEKFEGSPAFALMKPTPRVVVWGTRVFVFAGMNSVKQSDGKWYPRATYNEQFAYYLT